MTENPNEYIVFEEETYIRLVDKDGNHKAFAIIDTEDLERVKPFRWYYVAKGNSGGYAATNVPLLEEKRKTLFLHELITESYKNKPLGNFDVDHVNNYSLNNRKSNLRICSHSSNLHNSKLHSDNTSGHKGICYDKNRNKWVARIQIKGKMINLGRFSGKEEAIRARKEIERRV